MFVVARTTPRRIHEVQAYLYAGQTIVRTGIPVEFGSEAAIVESVYGLPGKMLADRLMSGMIGASSFETLEEAEAYVRDELRGEL
jgi:hypothetical protein